MELEALRQKASSLYLESEYMRDEEETRLNAEYETLLGVFEYEKFKAEIEGKRIQKEIELVQIYINRNEPIDQKKVDEDLQSALSQFLVLLENKKTEIKKARRFLAIPLMTAGNSQELTLLYRLIAKSLHPDLNPNLNPDLQDLFLRAISAYQERDIDALRHIVQMINSGKEADLSKEEIKMLMDQARKSIAIFQERIDQMNARFPFTCRDKLKDKMWVVERQETLKEEIVVINSVNLPIPRPHKVIIREITIPSVEKIVGHSLSFHY